MKGTDNCKNWQMGLHKIKKLYNKGNNHQSEDTTHNVTIFATYTSDRVLISRTHKHPEQQNKWTDCSQKEKYKKCINLRLQACIRGKCKQELTETPLHLSQATMTTSKNPQTTQTCWVCGTSGRKWKSLWKFLKRPNVEQLQASYGILDIYLKESFQHIAEVPAYPAVLFSVA